ncbi:hypothetical protein [Paraburkholderia sp.]|jgi:hypothetical protein|uniref:dihydrofolate reductase family protein n=1 Tax=Paraburkholderia sp. TaxID=1926495 RepID=UPI00261C07CB|nr:hypothetical protein [Paraburkholderia sp.]
MTTKRTKSRLAGELSHFVHQYVRKAQASEPNDRQYDRKLEEKMGKLLGACVGVQMALLFESVGESTGRRFDLLLGRRTYDMWSAFWPKAPSSPMAEGLNAATKYVATHRPESLEWGPCEWLGPDIVAGIRRIEIR